jgi:hydrogenase large subunit
VSRRMMTRPLPMSHRPSATGPGPALWAALARDAGMAPPNSDPSRRIGGGMVLNCEVDLASRRVSDAAAVVTMFNGYESLLPKRGLDEAGLIGSTASGICGGVHAAASAQCLEMALGIRPPPLAVVARNLLMSCQHLSDNTMHLFVLCGPDYSEDVVKATNPEIWAHARHSPALHAATHGYATVGAIMTALNRADGPLVTEALDMVRRAREAYRLMSGKSPRAEAICPGGVTFPLDGDQLAGVRSALLPFIDYAKRCARIWDDVFDFLYDRAPAFRDLGRAPATLVDFGLWDHEDHYDASYEHCDDWGVMRWSTPGAVINGVLATTSLSRLNRDLQEFVDSSFYDPWRDHPHVTDPAGAPLDRQHPWNKTISRNPSKEDGARPYSWATSIAWNRNIFEVGAYARLYISALAGKIPANASIESTGHSLMFHLPAGQRLAPARLEWVVPPVWNALERNRARAHALAFSLMVALENIRRAEALLTGGERRTRTTFEIPLAGRRLGIGFGGAARGLLAHWAVLNGGRIDNYQLAVPSRINAAPRSPWGEPGPCEQALLNTPILETNWSDPASFHGIDLVRTVQSFDPCMPCDLRLIFKGTDFASTVKVNTTA